MKTLSVREFDNEFRRPARPVILTAAVDSWTARRWSPRDLAARFPEVQVPVSILPEANASKAAYYLANRVHRRMTLREYAELMDLGADGRAYLENQPVPTPLDEELGEFPYYPRALARLSGQPPRLWMGPAGCVTALHTDPLDNLNVQLWGKKEWVIFPASARPALQIPSQLTPRNLSPIDLDSPGAAALLARLEHARVTLGPGETLFLPVEWPHYVRSVEPSLSVNFWFQRWSEALVRAPQFYLRRALRKAQHGFGRLPRKGAERI